MKDKHLAVVFLTPGLLLSAIFILVPLVMAIRLSLFKMTSLIGTPTFCGLDNYLSLIQDPQFWNALKNGIIYAGSTVILQLVLGIAFALVLNQNLKGRNILRGSVLMPYIIPPVVIAIIWGWMLEFQMGIITRFLKYLGLYFAYLETPFNAMITIIIISVWAWTPFVTICFLAALQNVPQELYESAEVDGASSWVQFSKITIPILMPVLSVVALLRGIWMFNKFDLIWILTGGGPLGGTEHLPIMAYKKAFGLFDVGGGSAVATLSLIFLSGLIFIYFKLMKVE
jgi:multiple sugar transport system permease protein